MDLSISFNDFYNESRYYFMSTQFYEEKSISRVAYFTKKDRFLHSLGYLNLIEIEMF